MRRKNARISGYFFLHFWVTIIIIIIIMIYAMPEIYVHTDASVIINYLRLIFSLCIFTMYMPHCHHILKMIIIIISFNAFFVYVCMSCYRKLRLIIIIFAIMTPAWNSIVTVEARN